VSIDGAARDRRFQARLFRCEFVARFGDGRAADREQQARAELFLPPIQQPGLLVRILATRSARQDDFEIAIDRITECVLARLRSRQCFTTVELVLDAARPFFGVHFSCEGFRLRFTAEATHTNAPGRFA
jgi:hypothetical protein